MAALACLTNQSVCLVRGQALDFVITVLDNDGNAADLAGSTITMGIATSERASYLFTLPTSRADNVITGELSSAQAETLAASKYYFSTWVEISGESTPVAKGFLTIEDDSRTV